MEAPSNPQMVKEAPPNPQCVGREFVRQYYTLLNACPAHLHRFYNNNSSFVHGGMDAPNRETKPVVGQKQIHQKIQQLNFRDCHAKITQVDSQATLGNGVVVQVTGELSNCGQPMRRFTQTFVLAAQSPKQYYVHNDIFRYQDIMFSDEEVEQDSGHSAAEEDVEPEHTQKPEPIVPIQPMQPPQTMAYYSATTGATTTGPVQPQPPISGALPHQMVASAAVAASAVSAASPMPPPVVATPVAAVVNGSAHPEEVISVAPAAPSVAPPPLNTIPPLNALPQAPIPIQTTPAPLVTVPQAHPTQEDEAEPEQTADEEGEGWGDVPESVPDEEKEKAPQDNPEDIAHHSPETTSSEPKTYANLVKSGTVSFSSAISTSPNVPTKPASPPPPPQRPLDSRDGIPGSTMPPAASGSLGLGQRGARRGGSVRGMARPDRGTPGRSNFSEDSSTAGGDGHNRRMGNMTQQYADTQQLFMGNLPHQATEDDLRDLFSKFGPIIDLRILSKHNSKNMPGSRVPNYGFIVFESAATVKAVLNSRPIFYPDESGQKLNVEEKKTKTRPMDGNRMGSGGDTMLGGGRPNSGIGGRGAPGMMRGSPGMHRGGGRGGFPRGDGRGGGMNRAAYTRR